MIKIIAVLLSISVFFTSCASSTVITSQPNGAKVYLNGQHVGNTPYEHSDMKIVSSLTTFELKKEGYEDLTAIIWKDEEINIPALVGGILFYIPFLWIMGYQDGHNYELTPLEVKTETKSPPKINISSKADRIRELKKLVDEGLLTTEEFEKEKKKILEEDEN